MTRIKEKPDLGVELTQFFGQGFRVSVWDSANAEQFFAIPVTLDYFRDDYTMQFKGPNEVTYQLNFMDNGDDLIVHLFEAGKTETPDDLIDGDTLPDRYKKSKHHMRALL